MLLVLDAITPTIVLATPRLKKTKSGASPIRLKKFQALKTQKYKINSFSSLLGLNLRV